MIEIRRLEKRLNGVPVLRGIDLTLKSNVTTVVLGRSGVGKTVLLKHIVGLMKPDAGDVLVDGVSLLSCSRRKLKAVRRRMSFVFQSSALFDSLSVLQNVSVPLVEVQKMPRKEVLDRSREAIEAVGLSDAMNLFPAELSGGMRKRAAVARALVSKPDYILYDEPTTGLDPLSAGAINDLILSVKERFSVCSIIVTHDLHSAFKVADRIMMLSGGVISWSGTPEEMRKRERDLIYDFLVASGITMEAKHGEGRR